MSTVTDLIAATKISDVWVALGGDPPSKHGRARAFYRDGRNADAVSLNGSKACWHDFVTGAGGGVLDLIQHVLGCDRGAALRWLATFTGVPLTDRAPTAAERRSLSARRERDQREMLDAEAWRIAVECVAEEILDALPEAVPARYLPTQLLLRLRASRPAALLTFFREWMERDPRLTAALVYAGARSRRRQADRLARFIVAGAEVSDAA